MFYLGVYVAVGVLAAMWRYRQVMQEMERQGRLTGHQLGGAGFVIAMSLIALGWPLFVGRNVARRAARYWGGK